MVHVYPYTFALCLALDLTFTEVCHETCGRAKGAVCHWLASSASLAPGNRLVINIYGRALESRDEKSG